MTHFSGVNDRMRNRRQRRLPAEEQRRPADVQQAEAQPPVPPNPPQPAVGHWRPWEVDIGQRDEPEEANQQPGHNNAADNVPVGFAPLEDLPEQRPMPALAANIRAADIPIPQAPAREGRRDQLYTLLRRNAETIDNLLNGRLLELMDLQVRNQMLLEQRLRE